MVVLVLVLACAAPGSDDSGDTGAVPESLVSGGWAGTLSGAWTAADGTAVELDAAVTLWLLGWDETTRGEVFLRGTTTTAGVPAALAGSVSLRLESPREAVAQPLVRAYGLSVGDPLAEACEDLEVADPRHFVCPFAYGDTWTWDGADTLEQARETSLGVTSMRLTRSP